MPENPQRTSLRVYPNRAAWCRTLCGLLAGIGGAFLASRVESVDPNTGATTCSCWLLAVGCWLLAVGCWRGGHWRYLAVWRHGLHANAVVDGWLLALTPNALTLVDKSVPAQLGEIDLSSCGIQSMCAGAALLVASSVDALSRRQSL